ncbi:hypothetical protein EsH8_II_001011 [Colletotrichum jinshuiense]
MFAKKALSVVASLALAEQALGFNAHRHGHDERAYKVDIVTHWVTVTYVEGEAIPTSTSTSATTTKTKAGVPKAQYTPSTTTSTSVVVVPTSTSTPVYVAPTTTLLTSAAPVASSQAPVVEQAVSVEAVVAAASSTTTSSKAATSTAASTSTGGKRGIAYNDATKVAPFFTGSCKECSWAYNWDSSDNGLTESGINYVPMLWGPIDTHTSRWQANADASIAKGSTHILSFNECDNASQCNLDAASAAAAHVKWVNPYAGKVKIGAPAITNSNIAGEGLDWLKSWVSACDTAGCSYDFCVTHWYSPSDAAQTLFDHIKSVNEICGGKPVWLTEFAPFGTTDQISSFVQTNIPKLDSISYLDRYSYFMASDGVLNSGSSLSALGQVYASA